MGTFGDLAKAALIFIGLYEAYLMVVPPSDGAQGPAQEPYQTAPPYALAGPAPAGLTRRVPSTYTVSKVPGRQPGRPYTSSGTAVSAALTRAAEVPGVYTVTPSGAAGPSQVIIAPATGVIREVAISPTGPSTETILGPSAGAVSISKPGQVKIE